MDSLEDILKNLGDTKSNPINTTDSFNSDELAHENARCETCMGRGWFTPEVAANHEDFGKILPCECQKSRILQERTNRLLRYSNIGPLSRFTFENLDPKGRLPHGENDGSFQKAYEVAKNYANDTQGWLTVTGPTASGKTHLAAAVANQCISKGTPVFFAHVPELLDHLRTGFDPTSEISYTDLFDQVRNSPLLVLDELDLHTSTPWAHEKLLQIINYRYSAELPTIVTTSSELKQIDPYIRTRLENSGVIISLENINEQAKEVHQLGRIDTELTKRMTFKNFDVRSDDRQRMSLTAAYEFAVNYAADPHGWLTLFGSTGTGKTHLAVAISVERLNAGESVFFAFVPELLDYLRYTFKPDSRVSYDNLFDEVKRANLLVLDDLGTEHSSPWAEEKLYQIIVHRHNNRLPTVITSSLDFTEQMGPISSRIRDPYVGELIRLDAQDYRIKKSSDTLGKSTRMRRKSP
ncbi:MAG: ATP-binding protein [Chloroflexota bacterium]|nr:ATP-binding protein [Chloroflexota bacterium]